MRLTIDLEERAYEAANSLAEARGCSVDAVVNHALLDEQERAGEGARPPRRVRNGFVLWEVEGEVTPEMVKECQDR